jgi:hypothetical protein
MRDLDSCMDLCDTNCCFFRSGPACLTCSHIADLPVAKMSAFCSLPKRLGQTDSSSLGASFPSATWIRHWAAHIAAYLHPRLSHDQPVLVTQLIMLLGVMVAVSDWLKVYPR